MNDNERRALDVDLFGPDPTPAPAPGIDPADIEKAGLILTMLRGATPIFSAIFLCCSQTFIQPSSRPPGWSLYRYVNSLAQKSRLPFFNFRLKMSAMMLYALSPEKV